MQMSRRSDPQRRSASVVADGVAGSATNGKAAAKPTGQWGVYPTADAAVNAAEAAFQEYRTRPLRGPQESGRVHQADLRRASRGAWPGRARRDEDRPARPQDRQAPRRDPASARGRIPPDRQRLGRQRPDAHGLLSVRRHRSDHPGDPQPAHPGGQRDQHAGIRQYGGLQRPPVGGEDRRRRGSAASTRRSSRRSDSTICSRSSIRQRLSRPRPCSTIAASACWW